MKKIFSLLIIGLLFITACGNKKEDYYLNYSGKKIELNKEFNVNDYGEYNDLFENESCAFGNRDITYFYDDIEVEAYGDDNNKLIVYSIKIISENIKTNEGISLYDTISEAINVYGKDYSKDDNKYTFTSGNTSIIFITQNDIIASIEYRISNMV